MEDLEERVFFCVTDSGVIDKFFKHEQEPVHTVLTIKRPDEFFDPKIVARFSECGDDLEGMALCYITGNFTACIFHLMKVVEAGLMEVAKLAGIADPKASWGAVLSKVDQYCFQTKYDQLPDIVKPHRELLRELSPEMHAIQHAWRNKVCHIENKLIPIKEIDQPIAFQIMTAVEVFMSSLADRLPAKS